MATRKKKTSNNKKKLITIVSSLAAGLGIVFIVFLFMNTYYKDNYATKKYVVDALANAPGDISEEQRNAIAAQLTRDLTQSLDSMQVDELSEEQLKTLLGQVETYLSSEFTTMASEQVKDLTDTIVTQAIAEKLGQNETLLAQYRSEITNMRETQKQLQSMLDSVNNYTYDDIYNIAKQYGLSKDDVDKMLANFQTQNSQSLKDITNKFNISNAQLMALIAKNSTSGDAQVKELSEKLGMKDTELEALINNFKNTLSTRISQNEQSTNNNFDKTNAAMPRYTYSTDENGKTTVTMTIPSGHY